MSHAHGRERRGRGHRGAHGPDPSAPLVVDTRELGRRPGAMRRLRREVPAPPGLVGALAAVEPGAPLVLDLRLEAVVDGVLVSGEVTVPLRAECSRCLEPVDDELTVDLQGLYSYPEAVPAYVGDDERGELVQGDLVDLEPAVRDAVVLELPLAPLCGPDCEGLCPDCGARLADLPADHSHERADPRWAALEQLRVPQDGPAQP